MDGAGFTDMVVETGHWSDGLGSRSIAWGLGLPVFRIKVCRVKQWGEGGLF